MSLKSSKSISLRLKNVPLAIPLSTSNRSIFKPQVNSKKTAVTNAMSSSSGILPSPGLVSKFNNFVRGNSRALILKIDKETIVVDQEIEGSSSFANDWTTLYGELNDEESRYVFVRDDQSASPYLVFISYVPDDANVRQKMIYASTKSSMLRVLGNEDLIKKQYLINDHDEISYKGYCDIQKSEALEAPLTESEKSLKHINEVEAKAFGGSSGVVKRSLVRMDHSTNMKGTIIEEEVFEKVNGISVCEFVRVKINSDETVYLVDSKIEVTPDSVPSVVAEMDGPQYVLYKSPDSHLFFIYSCPSGSKIRDRMMYASTKQGFLAQLQEKGVTLVKVIEVGDAIEIEVGDLKHDSADSGVDSSSLTGVSQLRHSKPRGPRRR